MYVKVLVTPGAKRESLLEKKNGSLAISVKEPAEQNLANRRVVQLVAAHYGVRSKEVRILSGHHSRSKMLGVEKQKTSQINSGGPWVRREGFEPS